MVFNEQVINWVKRSLENEELQEIVVEFSGHSEIGFISEINFVTATGLTKENVKKIFNLGVKFLKNSQRKMDISVLVCKVEIYVYSTVFPVLKKFLIDKELKKEIFSIPIIHWYVDSQSKSVIVMQNLKESGYMLHNKQQHLNMNHLKVVLKDYGKFHAISFALRDQKPELFEEIAKYLFDNDTIEIMMNVPKMKESLKNNLNSAFEILEMKGDKILHDKLCKTFLKPPNEVMKAILDDEESQTSICHGDSWNNNFLFKYKVGKAIVK